MTESDSPLLIIAPNPAWQRTLQLSQLIPGSVHRGLKLNETASGKGINVAKILYFFGQRQHKLLHFLGGVYGDLIAKNLSDLELNHRAIATKNHSRIATTLCHDQHSTEIIDPHCEVSELEWNTLAEVIKEEINSFQQIVITGSFPNGPCQAVLKILEQTRAHYQLYYDGLRPDLLALKPDLLKINLSEAQSIANLNETEHLCDVIQKKYALKNLIITCGSEGVLWKEKDQKQQHLNIAPIDHLVNPIGAGDTFMAAVLYAKCKGADMCDTITFGHQMAALKCGVSSIDQMATLCKNKTPSFQS